jgi:hypothetical protein
VSGSGGRIPRILNLGTFFEVSDYHHAPDRILPGTNLIGSKAILDDMGKRNICCCCRESDRFFDGPPTTCGTSPLKIEQQQPHLHKNMLHTHAINNDLELELKLHPETHIFISRTYHA